MYTETKRFLIELVKPRNSTWLNDEDLSRKVYIFNVSILTILSLVSLHAFAIVITLLIKQDTYNGVPISILLLILSFYLSLFLLFKKGYIKTSINIFVASLSLIVLATQIKWGFDFPSAVLMWPLIIVLTSILVGTRTAIVLSLLITVFAFTSISLESIGVIDIKKSWKDYNLTRSNAIEYGFIFLAISTISWMSNKEIYKSLVRARKSESDLQYERDNLDIKVREKTRELQDAQIEKINHMYRLVEFGRLSSGLFHDLSSPLTAMAMEISEGQKTSSLSTETTSTEQKVNHLINSTKKIIIMVEKAKRQIQINDKEELFCVNNEISDVIAMLKSKSHKSKVTMVFNCDKNLNHSGSSVIFSHIINNLVSNAIDSYKDVIDVRERKVFVWLNKDSKNIKITVKDFGSGINSDIQDKIFEPFFTTKELSGCGIGLSATKHNLEKYFNGTIILKSSLDKGCTFEVLIPRIKSV